VTSTRAIVFANGSCGATGIAAAAISSDDFLVCVDGGLRYCLSAGHQPDLIIGDFDSVDQADLNRVSVTSNPERIAHPPEKDASDLELTLSCLGSRDVDEVVLLGVSGGRTDHMLFNWHLCARDWPYAIRLIDETVDAYLVQPGHAFDQALRAGRVFSVVVLGQIARGITITGSEYPLVDATVAFDSSIGLSNVVNGAHLQVTVAEGKVLVLVSHEKTER